MKTEFAPLDVLPNTGALVLLATADGKLGKLAGDLDHSGLVIATAFNRLHPLKSNTADGEEERRNNAATRVENVGQAVLGRLDRRAR